MGRFVAYCRVGSDQQAESGAGLRAQEDACLDHAARLGRELVGPFVDAGVSGAAPIDARPGLVEALALIGPDDVLLVARRDRLGRDPIVVAMIESAVNRQGGRVVSVAGEGTEDNSPASILMRRVTDGVAEDERLVLKLRTRMALQAKKRRGQRTGSVPFGFDLVDDGQRSKSDRPIALVPRATDAATAVLIHQLRAEGRSLRGIAAELDRRGIPPKKGERWGHASVRMILARPIEPTAVATTGGADPCHRPPVRRRPRTRRVGSSATRSGR